MKKIRICNCNCIFTHPHKLNVKFFRFRAEICTWASENSENLQRNTDENRKSRPLLWLLWPSIDSPCISQRVWTRSWESALSSDTSFRSQRRCYRVLSFLQCSIFQDKGLNQVIDSHSIFRISHYLSHISIITWSCRTSNWPISVIQGRIVLRQHCFNICIFPGG